jgi:hypothetical protein
MVWNEFILEQFDLVNRFTTDESEFYDPNNSLLGGLFLVAQHYQVAPQFKRITGSMDFSVFYIVPVLFIEIKTFLCLDHDSSRAAVGPSDAREVLRLCF